ncbi:YhcN/YlaJ family sporulation lipoprotein [Metabacillus hrfriensis]|uniref:YhcN/YlaJ family sporulation lipoprotein n=1 Tax=Metabacillus hrfriensis TaxID=3048891 RepID=A0ACD4RG25_9BACI|nr:YhcN/YlaJ family sporulation lipoprotein [Metabacillus sp. CT-WN-B3]WHZ59475.1 YhcN/YlaJ family sporulation lipoprotein [Metabacillus sp. CT-WN-B3]
MKDKTIKLIIFLIILTAIGLSSGCNGNLNQQVSENNDMNIEYVHTSGPIDQTVANQSKEKVVKKEEISSVKAVNTDKELLLAVKVHQFDRFRLKSIKKKLKLDIEKMHPEYKIFVSTDQKIYLELEQLEQKLQKDHTQMKSLKKDFDKIKSLMKEKA